MQCSSIKAFIERDKDNERIPKTIVAFNERFHYHSHLNTNKGNAVVTYLPERAMLDENEN